MSLSVNNKVFLEQGSLRVVPPVVVLGVPVVRRKESDEVMKVDLNQIEEGETQVMRAGRLFAILNLLCDSTELLV